MSETTRNQEGVTRQDGRLPPLSMCFQGNKEPWLYLMIFQDHPLHTHNSARTLVFFHPDQEPILRKAARSPVPPQAGSLLTVIEAGIEITVILGLVGPHRRRMGAGWSGSPNTVSGTGGGSLLHSTLSLHPLYSPSSSPPQ